MRGKILWVFCLFSLALIAAKPSPVMKEAERTLAFALDFDSWVRCEEREDGRGFLEKYIRKNEQVENATEIFTILYQKNFNRPLSLYFQQFKKKSEERNPSNIIRLISSNDQELFLQWVMESKNGYEYGLQKILRGGSSLYILTYNTTDPEKFDQSKEHWQLVLNSAHLYQTK